jgi:hypothetical protein
VIAHRYSCGFGEEKKNHEGQQTKLRRSRYSVATSKKKHYSLQINGNINPTGNVQPDQVEQSLFAM